MRRVETIPQLLFCRNFWRTPCHTFTAFLYPLTFLLKNRMKTSVKDISCKLKKIQGLQFGKESFIGRHLPFLYSFGKSTSSSSTEQNGDKKQKDKKPSLSFLPCFSPLGTFLWLLLVMVTVFSFLNFKREDILKSHNYVHKLVALQQENVVLGKYILQECQSYQQSFDVVFAHIKELQDKIKDLRPLPQFLSISAATTLEEKRLFYLATLEENKKTLQELKKARDFMGSSLDAFSIEVVRCNTFLLKRNKMEKVIEIRSLFHTILLYNTPLQQNVYKNIVQKIKKLKTSAALFDNKKDLENYWRIIRLAQNIVTTRTDIDRCLQTLSDLSEIDALQEMHDIYMGEYERMIANKNKYGRVFLISFLLHILLSAATLFFLRKNEKIVKEIKHNIDDLVAERIADLNQRHEELNDYITELCNVQERFDKVSVTDELTGLYTRRFLFEWLQKQMSLITRTPGSFCCMMIDIDSFKKLNEEHGYLAGDEILKKVAAILREQVREDDIICRYGGEEFLIFLSQSDFELAKPVAERIRKSIAEDITKPEKITVSIGLAVCRCKKEYRGKLDFRAIMSDLIERADLALFEAKENGRNRTEICEDVIELV